MIFRVWFLKKEMAETYYNMLLKSGDFQGDIHPSGSPVTQIITYRQSYENPDWAKYKIFEGGCRVLVCPREGENKFPLDSSPAGVVNECVETLKEMKLPPNYFNIIRIEVLFDRDTFYELKLT